MIIDAHMHLFEKMLGADGYPASELRRKMEAEGVTAAWAMTGEGFFADTRKWNEWLLAVIEPHRDFFRPFCTVDPKKGYAAVKEFEYFVRDRGMCGLKLHPWLQAFPTTLAVMDKLLAACGRLGVPLIVHDGSPPYATPLQFARLAEKHPHTTIILGHTGLKDMWPDAVRAARRCRNIILCTCATPLAAIRRALKQIGPHRIIFGSDCGGVGSEGLLKERIIAIRSLYGHGISSVHINNILYVNASRLLPVP